MMAVYASVIKRSAVITLAVAIAMVAISAGVSGVKGLIGSLIGIGVVAVFFGISVVVVGRAARVNPQVMMIAALGSYIVKFIALAALMIWLSKSTAFSGRLLGLTAIVCILTWSAAQVITSMKLKVPYVEPELER
jgi:ATP synthase protein I